MGQYQQWLHYREVDQHLQAQLELLERELAQLHEHAHLLEQSIQPLYDSVSAETSSADDQELLQTDNQIIHALADSLNGRFSPMVSTSEDTFTPIPTSLPETPPNQLATLRCIQSRSSHYRRCHLSPILICHCCQKIWELFLTNTIRLSHNLSFRAGYVMLSITPRVLLTGKVFAQIAWYNGG